MNVRDGNGGYLWIKMPDRANEPRVTGGYQVNWKSLDGETAVNKEKWNMLVPFMFLSWLICYSSLYEYKQQVQALSRVLRTQPDPAPYTLTKARHPNASVLWKDNFKESEADVQPTQTEQIAQIENLSSAYWVEGVLFSWILNPHRTKQFMTFCHPVET